MVKSLPREVAVMKVVNGVRSLFHELSSVAQEIHGGAALAGGRRGVLLNLLEDGDQTVPTLARRRPVSRQHIQTLVNELLREGLVVRRTNPAHQRSKLVSLTPKGRRRITGMVERENELLRVLDLAVESHQLIAAAEVLAELRMAFRDPEWRASITEA